MTPKSLLLAVTVSIMTGTQAFEALGRGMDRGYGHNPGYGGINHGGRPRITNPPRYPGPGRLGPVRPGPVRPGPIYPAPINRHIQRVIYIGRGVQDETLYLQQLGDLFYSAQGYVLESIEVELTPYYYNPTLKLLINGYVEDSDYSAGGYTVLRPMYNRVFGRDLSTLALHLQGSGYIDRITVNLRSY